MRCDDTSLDNYLVELAKYKFILIVELIWRLKLYFSSNVIVFSSEGKLIF